jgi:hypothetical protein
MTYERKHQGYITLYNRKQLGYLNVGLRCASKMAVSTSTSWEVLLPGLFTEGHIHKWNSCSGGMTDAHSRLVRLLSVQAVEICLVSKMYRSIFLNNRSSRKNKLFSVVYFPTLSVSRLYSVEWYNDWKGPGRKRSCLMEVLSRHVPGGTEESHRKPQSISSYINTKGSSCSAGCGTNQLFINKQ